MNLIDGTSLSWGASPPPAPGSFTIVDFTGLSWGSSSGVSASVVSWIQEDLN